MSQKIRMKITSKRYETEASLFSEAEDLTLDDLKQLLEGEPEEMVICTEGTKTLEKGRLTLRYEETELTGMAGSVTEVSFMMGQSGLVTMTRGGTVSTALVFEAGRRHRCVYRTPYMPFEICVHTLKVDNRLVGDGVLELDYVIEIQGARAERTKFRMEIYSA